MPLQDGMHRRVCRTGHSVAFKTARDLARTPSRMSIAHRQDALLDRGLGPHRARMRTARAVRQFFLGGPPAKPFVPSLRMDSEPPEQLSSVRPFLYRQSNKLSPLIHDR